jgi:ribosome biogenesis protein ENP2
MKDVNFSQKKLKRKEEYTNRIEILQDFDFPITAGFLKCSKDGNYIFASGIYPPKLKIYDLNEMSLKCERNFDSEIRKFEVKKKIILLILFICI